MYVCGAEKQVKKMTSREQFEAWAGKHYVCIKKLGENGSYDSEPVQIAWEGWQASRAAIEVELPERHYFCDNDGAFVDVSDVIYEIHHVGLKVKA